MNDFDYILLGKYFNLLGLELEDNPSKKEIKSAYRKLIVKNHPDKVSSLDKEIQDVAEKRTKELNEAFEYIEKNYTPVSMSEILKKLNEENLELKQKLNDLKVQLDFEKIQETYDENIELKEKLNDLKVDFEEIQNIINDEENQIGFWDKSWLTRKEMLINVIFGSIVLFLYFWFSQ